MTGASETSVAGDGGHGSDEAPIPAARPKGPSLDRIAFYLHQLDRRRIYTNYGPLSADLEKRCALMLGMDPRCVISTSNGTAALSALLLEATKDRPGLCLMPSWTFSATPAAAIQAGLTPHFLDVDPETWSLNPHLTLARITQLRPSAVVVVAPFGSPVDWEAWENIAQMTGVPVVIDAAAAFDAVTSADVAPRTPTMISLHATKVMGCGEGGVAIVNDPDKAETVRRILSCGFFRDRIAKERGFNGKLSEYHAAVGLAALDEWEDRRQEWLMVKRKLRRAMSDIAPITLGPDATHDLATSTFNVVSRIKGADFQAALAERGVMTLSWWTTGCADQPAYADYPKDPLPVTQDLGAGALGLPFFCDISDSDIGRIRSSILSIFKSNQTELQTKLFG